YDASVAVFHMKPASAGRLRLRSRDPRDLPEVERGFLGDPSDLRTIVEGLELTRALAKQAPLARLLGPELAPGEESLQSYARRSIRNYFHPAGHAESGVSSMQPAAFSDSSACSSPMRRSCRRSRAPTRT